ncbi:septation protein SpoVG family protein [Candidatus Marinimicrobia bacterium]|nr:septation protein SpoVG family protein [Candidatus Neomarinimicrobiota bacterium]
MKIERMNKGSWGKVRAFFDLRTEDGFVVKGFKIIEGINGLFVSMPSQKGKNAQGEEEYFDTVWVEKELRDQLNQTAINEYGSENTSFNAPSAESASAPESAAVNQNSNEDNNKSASFSEDEIPF